MSRPVVIAPDLPASGHQALCWAAAAAHRRRAELQVVVAERQDEPAAEAGPRSRRRALFADTLAAVRDAAPGLPMLVRTAHCPIPNALHELSADASILVVPTTLPDLTRAVATSYCPIAVIPHHGPTPQTEQGPVVLAAAPWTDEDVVALAFEEASAQHAPLVAVRAWTEPGIDLGRPRPDPIAEWDRARERAHRELEHALSPWRVIHPDVTVRASVVQDEVTELLVALSHTARLLVLGRSTRGALLSGISESPVAGLLRAARCPVLVVPSEGPPRTTWLPARERGWAFNAR